MLQAMKNQWSKRLNKWLITLFVVTLILPYLASLLDWSTLTKVVLVYFFINGGFALAFGWAIRQMGVRFYWVFGQALSFAVLSNWLFSLVNESYGYYLAFLYLVLTLFTYFAAGRIEPEENELPIDGGYQDV
ncbi:hypothetical protein LQZ24_01655 [Fructobacillus sp. M1-13]|uniref:Integral membrane protein n=1 Tax=Fructobacillus papyriferae TaxID=2713171 RepID=A0ABS5QNN8_9LACO|nr:hypothetical protein [Fructobacillus papyriferae]MBS9334744.1 hypothetical protein [Fructobacillus papyriferae]MCD2158734.1 hypothetical protein [Fructobacillus papyriferae]